MANKKDIKAAKAMYGTMCAALDEIDWKYEKFDDDFTVKFTVTGDDINMNFIMMIDAERELIRLFSPMPFKFPEDARLAGALATSQVNYTLADGSFDFDLNEGNLLFRLTSSYKTSRIAKSVFVYMVQCACYTVDEYNDKFYMLAKGHTDVHKFIEELK